MTKMIAILTAVLLAMIGLNAATTEATTDPTTISAEEAHELAGIVEEITDEYYIIKTAEGQRYQINLDSTTIFDGETPCVNDLIHVQYDGKMTRSIPAQVTALHIGCYYHTGAIVELTQEGFTLDAGEQLMEVHCQQELLSGLENGQQVKVYTNGIMTMSLPAQVNADLIIPLSE